MTFTGAVGSTNPLAALSVISSRNFLESAGIQAQSVNVVSTNSITFTGNVTTTASVTGTGTITVNADSNGVGTGTFTGVGEGWMRPAWIAPVSIKADQVSLIGTVKSGTATTTIQGSDNETIGLGSGAGHIQLTNLELGQIFSGALDIGGTTTGTITSDTATTGSQQGLVTLNAGQNTAGTDVVFSGGASTFAAASM